MSAINHAAVVGPKVELTDYQADHVITAGSIPTNAVANLSGTNTGDQVVPALATTTAAVGTSAGGSATTASKGDHVHATGAGTPTTSAIGDAAATGTGPAAAMTNHVHGREALSTATPIVESGAGATGTGVKSSREDHVHPAAAGGGLTMPAIYQAARTGAAAAAIAISAAATGHSIVALFNATTGQVTGITCTNVTWTQLSTLTHASSFYAIWVGKVAGGSSGTTIGWTNAGGFCTVALVEVGDTLTPTLGQSFAGVASNQLYLGLTGVTAGHLVAYGIGIDDTSGVITIAASGPSGGITSANGVALVVGYAPSTVPGAFIVSNVNVAMFAEIT